MKKKQQYTNYCKLIWCRFCVSFMTFTISTKPQNQRKKQNQNEKNSIQIANKQTLPYRENVES